MIPAVAAIILSMSGRIVNEWRMLRGHRGRTIALDGMRSGACTESLPRPANIATARRVLDLILGYLSMSRLTRTIKGLAIAGACGVGLCALAKKLRLGDRIAEFAQNVEGVPFPGTRIYSFLASRQFRLLYREIAEEIVESGIDGRVLDLGTDMGYLPIELALLKPSVAVVGIDTSGDMAQIAQANARSEGLNGQAEFGTGDPTSLPFPGRYFDLVVSVNVLRHWGEPQKVLEEFYHVLSPGGELWVYDYKRDIPATLWARLSEQLQAHQRMLLQIGPMTAARNALREDEMLRMAEEAHFEKLSSEDKCLTMFDECMPVFTLVKLRKPQTGRD